MSTSVPDFDVFLCHNSKDKATVRNINEALRQEYNLLTFLDESTLVGGEEWEQSIRSALARSKTCAILVGGNGWGGYQLSGEAKPALERHGQDATFRLIPVLLSGANPEAMLDLREFFEKTHWVDFRIHNERAAIRTLASAIRGENPFPEGRPELTTMRVTFDAIRWDVSSRRDASILYAGKQLREANDLLTRQSQECSDLVRTFLSAGEQRQNESVGRSLGAHAAALVNNPSQRELAARLALEATRRFPTTDSHAVLTIARTQLPRVVGRLNHPMPVTALAVDSRGMWMTTGCSDGAAAFFDGKHLAMAKEHSAAVRAVVFDPVGSWVATGGDDGKVVIWNPELKQAIVSLAHPEPIAGLEVRKGAEGSLLLASSGTPGHVGPVSLWDPTDWKQILGGLSAMDAALDTTGTRLALAWGDSVVVHKARTGDRLVKYSLGATVVSVAMHPKMPVVAANTFTRQIWIGNLEQDVDNMRLLGDSIIPSSQIRFSPGGRWLAALGDDFRIRVWDVATQDMRIYSYKGLVATDFGFSPHDGYLSVVSKERGSITFWHLESGRLACTLTYDNPIQPAFSDDERMILAASLGSSAQMLVMPNQDPALWSVGVGHPWGLTFSPDGRMVAWTGLPIEADFRIGPPTVAVLDTQRGATLFAAGLPDSSDVHETEIVFEPEGQGIAALTARSSKFWDIASGAEQAQEMPSWARRPGPRTASHLLNKPRVAEACRTRKLVAAVASLDEMWLALNHGGQLVSVWNSTEDRESFSFSAKAGVGSMAFSPNGDLFAAGDDHGNISVWTTSGQPVAQFEENEPIIKLVFSPDGSYLVAGSAEGALRLWIVGNEVLSSQVRSRLRENLTPEEWERYIGDEPYPGLQSAAPSA